MRDTREPHDPHEPPYWQSYVAIGEAPIQGERTPLRMRLHTVEEGYRERQELVPLKHPKGRRLYLHGRPYILLPDIRLTVALAEQPSVEGAIGTVLSSTEGEGRPQEIGNAQAWFYPKDKLLVLWECYLYDWCRQEDPRQDEALSVLWEGFERVLAERLPAANRIVTPAWEDIYERSLWQAFLTAKGYQPFNEQAMVKEREG